MMSDITRVRLRALTKKQQAVLDAIKKRGTRVTVQHIAGDLGISVNAVYRRMDRLYVKGLIKKAGIEVVQP